MSGKRAGRVMSCRERRLRESRPHSSADRMRNARPPVGGVYFLPRPLPDILYDYNLDIGD